MIVTPTADLHITDSVDIDDIRLTITVHRTAMRPGWSNIAPGSTPTIAGNASLVEESETISVILHLSWL